MAVISTVQQFFQLSSFQVGSRIVGMARDLLGQWNVSASDMMETQRARVWFAPFLPSCPVTGDVPEDGCATSLEAGVGRHGAQWTHLDLKGVGYLAFHDWSCILFRVLEVNNKRNSWKSWKWSARRTVGCGQVEQETVPFHFKPCTSIWLKKKKKAMVPTEHISQATRWMCK